MEYIVSGSLNQVDFGATGVTEILQNVQMILATPEFSCPMDRGFAWSPEYLDAPINIAQAKLTARIVVAIRNNEPRAQVVSVTYQVDGIDGILKPTVKVRIADDTV
jgi:phage baseplate assembly protein W